MCIQVFILVSFKCYRPKQCGEGGEAVCEVNHHHLPFKVYDLSSVHTHIRVFVLCNINFASKTLLITAYPIHHTYL